MKYQPRNHIKIDRTKKIIKMALALLKKAKINNLVYVSNSKNNFAGKRKCNKFNIYMVATRPPPPEKRLIKNPRLPLAEGVF